MTTAGTHYVYLTNDETEPEKGTEGEDWIFFVCGDMEDLFMNMNTKTTTAGHIIFEIKIGKMEQNFNLKKCIIMQLGDDGQKGSIYYNSVKKFMIESCLPGGDTLYLMIYEPIDNASTDWMQYLDGDDSWQDYLKVRVAGFRFRFSAKKRVFEGSIMLEEVTV